MKFVTNLNLNQNELQNGKFQVVATDPIVDNFEGRLIYNSTEKTIKVYTGTAWRKMLHSVSVAGSASAALTVGESNGAVTLTPNLATASYDGVMSSSDKAKLDAATADATANTLALRDVNGNIKVATPTEPLHAANKSYVDGARSGLDVKQSVKLATNATLPAYTHLSGVLTGSVNGALSIDGANPIAGNRILVKNEISSNAPHNGIYDVTNPGSPSEQFVLTRSSDADSDAEVTAGLFVFVEQGDNWADSGWVLTTDGAITVGTTNLTFVQFSSAGQSIAGNGLTKSGNTIDVVGTADRITANADSIDIASTYAGQSSINTLGTVTTGAWSASTIAVQWGGTGQTSFTDNGVIYGNAGGALDVTAAGTQYQVLQAGAGGVPEFGAVNLAQSAATTNELPVSRGGTNASTEANARQNLAAGGTQGAGVSTPVLARKVVKTIGNGVDTSFTLVHDWDTTDVMVQVYQVDTGETVIADTLRTDQDTVTINFSVAPTSNAYKVVVIG